MKVATLGVSPAPQKHNQVVAFSVVDHSPFLLFTPEQQQQQNQQLIHANIPKVFPPPLVQAAHTGIPSCASANKAQSSSVSSVCASLRIYCQPGEGEQLKFANFVDGHLSAQIRRGLSCKSISSLLFFSLS